MSSSLWSRPKQLALNSKSRICIISKKEGNLVGYTQIFERIFLEMSVPFDFHPGISRTFGWMVHFSEIQQFPDFLELFSGNFRTIWPRFQHFEILGLMISAHCFIPMLAYRRASTSASASRPQVSESKPQSVTHRCVLRENNSKCPIYGARGMRMKEMKQEILLIQVMWADCGVYDKLLEMKSWNLVRQVLIFFNCIPRLFSKCLFSLACAK